MEPCSKGLTDLNHRYYCQWDRYQRKSDRFRSTWETARPRHRLRKKMVRPRVGGEQKEALVSSVSCTQETKNYQSAIDMLRPSACHAPIPHRRFTLVRSRMRERERYQSQWIRDTRFLLGDSPLPSPPCCFSDTCADTDRARNRKQRRPRHFPRRPTRILYKIKNTDIRLPVSDYR